MLGQDSTYFRATHWRWTENLFFGKFCWESLKNFHKLMPGFAPMLEAAETEDASGAPAGRAVNVAWVAGRMEVARRAS